MNAPEIAPMIAPRVSPLHLVLDRFSSDENLVSRKFPLPFAKGSFAAHRAFRSAWLDELGRVEFTALSLDGQVDYLLLVRHIRARLAQLDREERLVAETAPLLPFASRIATLHDLRLSGSPPDGRDAAEALDAIHRDASAAKADLDARRSSGASLPPLVTVCRALRHAAQLKQALADWFTSFSGFDPLFSWWTAAPHEKAAKALDDYLAFLRRDLLGEKDEPDAFQPIVGDPIGTDALQAELASEFIAYSPDELIRIGQREFKWCEERLVTASRDMGCADWRQALERVKNDHAAPGGQPELVHSLAIEAVEFLERNNLVTIPPLARDSWRFEMIMPAQQKLNPFFWGGESIGVSFAHATMQHHEKLMSMRGNNIHFARATVHHELLPGHHLQGFMSERYNRHRSPFGTAFYGEGWPLYWEMLLWDLGFAKSPENCIGMLFWRLHRAARVIFSLSFHLERMSPQDCIELLVDRVGHERTNAEAEVRRSFSGDYNPLYQCAYLIGGVQLRALRHELVDAGSMANRPFHDAILEANSMPIELLRALLTGQQLTRDHQAQWRFAD